jgi:ankyrin repeat protein
METARTSGISHPVCPLTEGELEERRLGFPRFWTEPDVPDRWARELRAVTALEIAAGTGNTESVDILREAGADESAWLTGNDEARRDDQQLFDLRSQNDGPISALPTSSPVHEAIAAGQVVMMWHLLSTCGYSPNYRPRAAPTVALPPLSFAIARCDIIHNPGIQRCLATLLSHPQLDANICTPIFNVHPLHFAIAHHDPELLTWLAGFIPGGLGAAGTTALGQTLLHVASLPLTGWHVNDRAPSIAKSIHCIRTLDSHWIPYPLSSSAYESLQSAGEQSARVPIVESKQHAQYATIQLLLEWGGCDVRVRDVDGNTALHYLAGTWNIHPEIIRLVRATDGGEDTWQKTRNLWGLTPSDLWTESSRSSGRDDNPNLIDGS